MRYSIFVLALATACGGNSPHSNDDSDGTTPHDLTGVPPPDLTGVAVDLAGADLTSPPTGSCLGANLIAGLGFDHILLGATMEKATAATAPFDGRYLYLSSGFPDGTGPCGDCRTSCATNGDACCSSNEPSCQPHDGCAWWGCWQYDHDPPGGYIRGFVDDNQQNKYMGTPRPLLPMITYYEELQASHSQDKEGPAQLAALEDKTFLTRYFNDWRFMLQQIGDDVVLLHIEPDMWGYVEQGEVTSQPARKPPVGSANATDCKSQPSTMTGFAQCMIVMVRKYAPNAKVGLHASPWGTNMDTVDNSNPSLDVAAEAVKLGDFMISLGAQDGDYLVADVSDRDAGYDQANGQDTWWDKTNATLPNFTQAFAWNKALAEHTQMPIVWWQIPVGNEALNDTNQHYKDNRVDYLLTHLDEVASAHIVGLFFGGGRGENTRVETDGGNLIAKVKGAKHSVCP